MVIFMERDVLIKELSPVVIARLGNDHFALLTRTEHITEEKMDDIHLSYKCHDSWKSRLGTGDVCVYGI